MDRDNQQEAALAELVRQAEAAKARAQHRARLQGAQQSPTKQKQDVSADDYVRRLNQSKARDLHLLKQVERDRIVASSAKWKQMVGATYANATVADPFIMSRLNRLKTGVGLHLTSLILCGNMGVGKTWNAYAYVGEAIRSGAVTAGQVKMGTETGLLSKIVSGGFNKASLLEELLNPRYRIYLVDEIGAGWFSNPNQRSEIWYELVDHIYTHQLTLIGTTNLPLGRQDASKVTLEDWVGVRAFDRMRSLVGGNPGFYVPGLENRRPQVLKENESRASFS